jgi:hypothetical protein
LTSAYLELDILGKRSQWVLLQLNGGQRSPRVIVIVPIIIAISTIIVVFVISLCLSTQP